MKNENGFTLIELLVGLTLSTIVIGVITGALLQTKLEWKFTNQKHQNDFQVKLALDAYTRHLSDSTDVYYLEDSSTARNELRLFTGSKAKTFYYEDRTLYFCRNFVPENVNDALDYSEVTDSLILMGITDDRVSNCMELTNSLEVMPEYAKVTYSTSTHDFNKTAMTHETKYGKEAASPDRYVHVKLIYDLQTPTLYDKQDINDPSKEEFEKLLKLLDDET